MRHPRQQGPHFLEPSHVAVDLQQQVVNGLLSKTRALEEQIGLRHLVHLQARMGDGLLEIQAPPLLNAHAIPLELENTSKPFVA